MKNLLSILMLSAILFVACKKSTDSPGPASPQPNDLPNGPTACKLAMVKKGSETETYKFNAAGQATERFVRNSSDQVTEVFTYEYSDGKLVKMNRYSDEAKMYKVSYSSFSVSAEKIVNSVYQVIDGGSKEISRTVYLLNSAGKLIGTEDYTVTDGSAKLTSRTECVTDDRDNIIVSSLYYGNGELSSTFEFEYDDKFNLERTMPIGTVLRNGKNNATRMVQKGKSGNVLADKTYNYTYNSEGYPTISNGNGTKYEYHCQ